MECDNSTSSPLPLKLAHNRATRYASQEVSDVTPPRLPTRDFMIMLQTHREAVLAHNMCGESSVR